MTTFGQRVRACLRRPVFRTGGPVFQLTCPGCPGKCGADCWCSCHRRSSLYLDVPDSYARVTRAAAVVSAAMMIEARKPIGERNGAVMNLCLDVRNALLGPADGHLVPAAALPRRYPVPVVAGPDGAEHPAERRSDGSVPS
jgi:hypothetical protein